MGVGPDTPGGDMPLELEFPVKRKRCIEARAANSDSNRSLSDFRSLNRFRLLPTLKTQNVSCVDSYFPTVRMEFPPVILVPSLILRIQTRRDLDMLERCLTMGAAILFPGVHHNAFKKQNG